MDELEQARSEAMKLGTPSAAVSAKVKLYGLDAPIRITDLTSQLTEAQGKLTGVTRDQALTSALTAAGITDAGLLAGVTSLRCCCKTRSTPLSRHWSRPSATTRPWSMMCLQRVS